MELRSNQVILVLLRRGFIGGEIPTHSPDPCSSAGREFRRRFRTRIRAMLFALRRSIVATPLHSPRIALYRLAARMDGARPPGIFRAITRSGGTRTNRNRRRRILRADSHCDSARRSAKADHAVGRLCGEAFWRAAERGVACGACLGAAASIFARARGREIHALWAQTPSWRGRPG